MFVTGIYEEREELDYVSKKKKKRGRSWTILAKEMELSIFKNKKEKRKEKKWS